MTHQRTALVTGGNRGLGEATARALAERGHHVVIGSRDLAGGEQAARAIGSGAVATALDVTDPASIARVVAELGPVDVLVNNAGIYPDGDRGVLDVDATLLRATFDTNLLGPFLLCQALVPGMRQRGWGRVVNVSSSLGQLESMTDVAPTYAMSKAALNALTRLVAAAIQGSGVLVNSADPGWVRTRMGGAAAPRSIDEGVDTIVWLATLPDGGPNGGFFRDRRAIAW